MFFSEATLPVSIVPYDDESGIGYCLRSISRNGASLHGLRRLLGIDNIGRFTAHHASHLGRVFQQPSHWFEKTLPSIEKTRPYQRDFYGHRWFSKNNLRSQSPQVCVQCIHAKGYCRAVWDVSIANVCVEHQCYLMDYCAKCRNPLRWDRPRVDVGHCGHILSSGTFKKAPDALIKFQTFLEKKFAISNAKTDLGDAHHYLGLDALSLSGVHAIVTSFGLRSKPFQVLHSTIRTRAYRTDEWCEFVSRGLSRLSVKDVSDDGLAYVVVESMLEHMALNHDSVQDQHFAVALLESVFDKKLRAELGSPLERLSQLELL